MRQHGAYGVTPHPGQFTQHFGVVGNHAAVFARELAGGQVQVTRPLVIAKPLPEPQDVVLSFGELASAFPRTGGQYVYLREAFSPFLGFMYGWTLFTVIQTGFISSPLATIRSAFQTPP